MLVLYIAYSISVPCEIIKGKLAMRDRATGNVGLGSRGAMK